MVLDMALSRLGNFIELTENRNSNLEFNESDVRGISIQKIFIPTKADMKDVSLTSYKLVKPMEFCYVPITSRNGEKITIALNDSDHTYICSSSYIAFKITDTSKILPQFLFMYFNRPEFDRYSRFNSWGSAREAFSWEDMCDVMINIPSLSHQKKLVDVYHALIFHQKVYDNSLGDLKLVCDIYIEELRRKHKLKKLSTIIKETKEINSNSAIDYERGLNKLKGFVSPSKMSLDVDISKRKIVRHNDFVYPSPHFGEQGTIGLFKGDVCIMSQMYTTFRIIEKGVTPEYLMLWFTRSEFMRYAFFAAVDSIRDTFSFEKLSEYAIPVPSIEIQENISKIYQNLDLRKNIIDKLKVKINHMLPVLIRGTSLSK